MCHIFALLHCGWILHPLMWERSLKLGSGLVILILILGLVILNLILHSIRTEAFRVALLGPAARAGLPLFSWVNILFKICLQNPKAKFKAWSIEVIISQYMTLKLQLTTNDSKKEYLSPSF